LNWKNHGHYWNDSSSSNGSGNSASSRGGSSDEDIERESFFDCSSNTNTEEDYTEENSSENYDNKSYRTGTDFHGRHFKNRKSLRKRKRKIRTTITTTTTKNRHWIAAEECNGLYIGTDTAESSDIEEPKVIALKARNQRARRTLKTSYGSIRTSKRKRKPLQDGQMQFYGKLGAMDMYDDRFFLDDGIGARGASSIEISHRFLFDGSKKLRRKENGKLRGSSDRRQPIATRDASARNIPNLSNMRRSDSVDFDGETSSLEIDENFDNEQCCNGTVEPWMVVVSSPIQSASHEDQESIPRPNIIRLRRLKKPENPSDQNSTGVDVIDRNNSDRIV